MPATDARFKLTLEEAKAQQRCRVCGESTTNGPVPVILCYGREHAHERCLVGLGIDWRAEDERRKREESPEYRAADSARLSWLERSAHVREEVRNLAAAELGDDVVDGAVDADEGVKPMTFREMIDGLMEKEANNG